MKNRTKWYNPIGLLLATVLTAFFLVAPQTGYAQTDDVKRRQQAERIFEQKIKKQWQEFIHQLQNLVLDDPSVWKESISQLSRQHIHRDALFEPDFMEVRDETNVFTLAHYLTTLRDLHINHIQLGRTVPGTYTMTAEDIQVDRIEFDGPEAVVSLAYRLVIRSKDKLLFSGNSYGIIHYPSTGNLDDYRIRQLTRRRDVERSIQKVSIVYKNNAKNESAPTE